MAANSLPGEQERERRDNAGPLLLEAAKRLFTERGFEEVSTRELADAAGVNLAAIQYHYGSKAKLFSEAVRSIMEGSGCAQIRTLAGDTPPQSSAEAADRLLAFINGYLNEMLRPRGPQACRIMFREMMSGTMENQELRRALVGTVVEHVTRPADQLLLSLLATIRSELKQNELERAVQSIIGQCSFYVVHQPFVEELRQVKCSDSPYFEETVKHVFRFTLRALGVDEQFINSAFGRFEGRQAAAECNLTEIGTAA